MSLRMVVFDVFLIRWLPLSVTMLMGAQGSLHTLLQTVGCRELSEQWGWATHVGETMGLQLTRRGLHRHLWGCWWSSGINSYFGGKQPHLLSYSEKVYTWLFKENCHESKVTRCAGCQKDRKEDLPLCVKMVFLSYDEWSCWPGWEVGLQTKCKSTKVIYFLLKLILVRNHFLPLNDGDSMPITCYGNWETSTGWFLVN